MINHGRADAVLLNQPDMFGGRATAMVALPPAVSV
jgi:hypothetical protein